MAKWRFKTEKEFEADFGKNFRGRANWAEDGGMDKYLGMTLTGEYASQADALMEGLIGNFEIKDPSSWKGFWVVQKHMLKACEPSSKKMYNYTNKNETEEKEMEDSEKRDIRIATLAPQTATDKVRCTRRVESMHAPAKLIQSVTFNEKKKTTTVVLKNGSSATVKCSANDAYDSKIGFCLAYMNALFGSKTQVQKAINEFNGVAKKERAAKELHEKLEKERALREYQAKQKRIAEKKKAAFEKQLADYTANYEAKKSAKKKSDK